MSHTRSSCFASCSFTVFWYPVHGCICSSMLWWSQHVFTIQYRDCIPELCINSSMVALRRHITHYLFSPVFCSYSRQDDISQKPTINGHLWSRILIGWMPFLSPNRQCHSCECTRATETVADEPREQFDNAGSSPSSSGHDTCSRQLHMQSSPVHVCCSVGAGQQPSWPFNAPQTQTLTSHN